jgi:hypothetical protein
MPPANADSSSAPAANHGHAPTDNASTAGAKHAAFGGGFVDSVSLSAPGEQLGGSVSYADGVYVATQPGPPVEHATGTSPADAASKLVHNVYRIT